jgi:hypothetical protein
MNPLAHLRHNVVAYLALFVALGTGTAFAAEKITGKDIAANAIKSKHVKNGQVKGADVATDSLTGDDIQESTLNLPTPQPVQLPAPPAPPAPEVDLNGFAKVVARGYLSGVGPLFNGDRCNSVGTSVPGVQFGDYVVLTPGSLVEDVVFTGAVNTDSVTYQACFTAASGEVKLNGDVRYMVLRMQQ